MPKTTDAELVRIMAEQGRSCAEIAEAFDESKYAVWRFAKRHGIEIRPTRHYGPRDPGRHRRLISAVRAGVPTCDVAERFGLTVSGVKVYLWKYGYSIRDLRQDIEI